MVLTSSVSDKMRFKIDILRSLGSQPSTGKVQAEPCKRPANTYAQAFINHACRLLLAQRYVFDFVLGRIFVDCSYRS